MSRPPLDPDLTRALHAIQAAFGVDQARVVAVVPASPRTAAVASEPAAAAAAQASLLDPEQHDPQAAAGPVPTSPARPARPGRPGR
jgi:hypothetical protein